MSSTSNELDQAITDSKAHLSAAIEHLVNVLLSGERIRALNAERDLSETRIKIRTIQGERDRHYADLKRSSEANTNLRTELDVYKAEHEQLTMTHHSLTDSLKGLNENLRQAEAARMAAQSAHDEGMKMHANEKVMLLQAIADRDVELERIRGDLGTKKQALEQLKSEKLTADIELQLSQETINAQHSQIGEIEDRLKRRDAELAELRPVAAYNDAIVHIWKDMSIKGKIPIARQLVEKTHPYYAQLEGAPGLMDACANRAGVQSWLSRNPSQFQLVLKDFPLQMKDASTAEEVLAGEVLQEYQDNVNRLLEKAQISIIRPNPGDPIDEKDHMLEVGSDVHVRHTGVVATCVRNGYRYESMTIKAVVQPALVAPQGVSAEAVTTGTNPTPVPTEVSESASTWYLTLQPLKYSLPKDSHVQEAMAALDRLLEKVALRETSEFNYSTLIPELTIVAPLFTENYPHPQSQQWLNSWWSVWTKVNSWLRSDLGIEPFNPKAQDVFDPEAMKWTPGTTIGTPEPAQIGRTITVGFLRCDSNEAILKATVIPPVKRSN